MVSEVRIYVEGGGDDANGRALIRQGFGHFLRDLNKLARSRGIRWHITACGSRNSTFEDFQTALDTHPDAFNVLLVDSEGPVDSRHSPWRHLLQRLGDKWHRPAGCSDEQCHLMVQTMESWLIADPDTLERFYKHGFNRNALPGNPRVEEIDWYRVALALRDATHNTKKREYHKIRHAWQLLEQLDVAKVRQAAPYCERLFTILFSKINN